MFRILRDPSSGSTGLCLTEISVVVHRYFVVCLVGVRQRNSLFSFLEIVVCVYGTAIWELVVPSRPYLTHIPQVQNYAAKHRPSTALYSLMMDHVRSETCWSDF
jgi:hypothetical protein